MKNFSETYKEIQLAWDKYLALEGKIKELIDDHDLMLFFKHKGDIYGTNEDGRLSYATMLDKEESKKLKDDLRIMAINLTQAANEEPREYIFSNENIKNIKKNIVSREDAEKEIKEILQNKNEF